MANLAGANRIVFISHYFPPVNSAGARRVEAMAKYFARAGRLVTVITTRKTTADGEFTESFPDGIVVHQTNWLGRTGDSIETSRERGQAAPTRASAKRKLKDLVMRWFGQLPDPRLPFAFSFLSPFLSRDVRRTLESADVIVGSCPPWPTLLAALFAGWRFRKRVVLEYRDHFSDCHEMPGTRYAKAAERWVDRALASNADTVMTISEPMARYYAGFNPRVTVILNGYDPEVLDGVRNNIRWQPRAPGTALVVRYLGIITPDRIPRNLVAALLSLRGSGRIRESSLRLEYYGESAVLRDFLGRNFAALLPMFVFRPPVPYREAIKLMVTSDYLLFCETSNKGSLSAQGILPTKMFEYLASGRPLLADIDPSTPAGQLIRKAGEHNFVSNHQGEFHQRINDEQFWNPTESVDDPFVRTFSRASQAEQYLRELDSMVAPTTPEKS